MPPSRSAHHLIAAAVVLGVTAVLAPARAASEAAVVKTYADIAEAGYADSLAAAKAMQGAIERLVAAPSADTLAAARAAWIAARVPYQQTEVYRFGNRLVDDWEGRVNAWPLDEGLIDYVAAEYGSEAPENEFYAANVIANPTLRIGGKTIDARTITKSLLADKLQEAGGVEANVATGFHAIEFLLWGQDRNGTGPGAGDRPASDFDVAACTGGNCARRSRYLTVVTSLLIDDLVVMAGHWRAGGAARAAVTEAAGDKGLVAMFSGLGSLAYGELAGERMKLGLLLHDPEEEHDCFSDNTHNSHFYNTLALANVYLGRYVRPDGSTVSGASLSGLVAAKAQATDAAVRAALDDALARMTALRTRAETIERYDQMIGQGNAEGNAVVQAAIDALIRLAKEFERAMVVLGVGGVKFEGSDSLDAPETVGGARP